MPVGDEQAARLYPATASCHIRFRRRPKFAVGCDSSRWPDPARVRASMRPLAFDSKYGIGHMLKQISSRSVASLIALAGVLSGPGHATPQTWRQLGPSVPATGRTMTPKLEMITSSLLMITFKEELYPGTGTVRVYSPSANDWVSLGLPGSCSDERDWWPRLAIDLNGNLYRASYQYSLQRSGSGLNLRTFDRSTRAWTRFGGLPLTSGESHMPDVAVDSSGNVFVSYQDGPGGNLSSDPQGAISVCRVDAITQQATCVGAAGFSDRFASGNASSAWATNIEIGPNDDMWVAWSESNPGGGTSARAAVAHFDVDLNAWKLVGGFGLGDDAPGSYINMVLGSTGRPHVATLHFGPSATNGIQVYRLNDAGIGWDRVGGVAGLSDHVTVSPEAGYRESRAFALSASDVPYVAYRGANQQNKICVRRFNAATQSWDAVGALGFSPGTDTSAEDDYISMAVRGETPIVAFRHGCSDPSDCSESELMVWAFH